MSRKKIVEKVILEKTGNHVKITEGPYTKRELRELLLSSLSLRGDQEEEFKRKNLKENELFKAENTAENKFDDLKNEIIVEKNPKNIKNNLVNLLGNKNLSNDLINRILKNGLTDEMIRLLKALGLTDEDISKLFGMLDVFYERGINKSEESSSSSSSSKSCNSSGDQEDHRMLTIEGFYLMSNFKNPLTKALADLVNKKPWNPVEYLGHWLLNHKICEERIQKNKEFHDELKIERERLIKNVDEIQNKEPNVSETDENWDFTEYE